MRFVMKVSFSAEAGNAQAKNSFKAIQDIGVCTSLPATPYLVVG